jgi:hypothetical protein
MDPFEANWLVLATSAVVVACALWFANRQRFVFRIAISNGAIQVQQGKVAGPFLDQVRAVCQEHSLTNGWVGGVRQGRRIRLVFSPSVPSGCQQQMRNIWAEVGWSMPSVGNRRPGRR